MRRVYLLLTVLCATGLPLTAAAFDYGSDPRLLASETGAPSLPGTRGEGNPFADMASHRAHADDEEDAPATANAAPEARPATARVPAARRNATPAATPGPGAAPPQHGHSVLSWQSLLPGSIQ